MPRLDVLLIGAGGREHALAWAMRKSPLLGTLLCAPGNPGIGALAEPVALEVADHPAVVAFCLRRRIGLVVIGPEAPLVAGLADALARHGIKAFGPSKAAARLEGSKGFTKDLCARHGIPTAAYGRFRARGPALAHVKAQGAPIVVKADGLAAGKGVSVATTVEQAEAALEAIFSGRFGTAECVIEEFLEGEEASFFALCDGTRILPLATAQDYKHAGEGDSGPNTGGMGATSPAPVMTEGLCAQALDDIVTPTVRALSRLAIPYVGVLYAGLIITGTGPKLIEYNVRFGDPETQALLMRLDEDILALMLAAVAGRLKQTAVAWRNEVALAVVLAAKGYPGPVERGSEIRGLEAASAMPGVEVFHAGTALEDGRLIAAGGRVLTVAALGKTAAKAHGRAYAAIDRIDWPQGFCRRDIGWRAVRREQGGASSE